MTGQVGSAAGQNAVGKGKVKSSMCLRVWA